MRLLLLSFLTTLALTASDKVALVIGNKNYTNQTGLKNPISDAGLIRDTLASMGFEVVESYNQNLNALSDKLDSFIFKAQNAKIAVIYYAGHGIGYGKNYLVPIGAVNLSVDNLSRKLMSVDELKGAVASAKGFGVVWFDACRNSTFSGSIRGLSDRGSRALVQPTVTRKNILVSFSTLPNTIANDDVNNGNHSPYAIALSEKLRAKQNVDIRQVMGSIQERVYDLTSHKKTPQHTIDESRLGGKQYCLSGVCANQVAPEPQVRIVEKIVYRERPQPMVSTSQRIVEPQTHSTQGTVTIDGLMYQNQPFTKEDDTNLGERSKGRVQTWSGAVKYCENLTLGGYRDWRLPTKNELRKLLTKTENTTASGDKLYIRKEFAKNFQKYGWAWSSTEKDSSSAWGVYFGSGNDFWSLKTNHFYAVCVR